MGLNNIFFQIMATGTTVLGWVNQALADGKITLSEAVDLVEQLGKIWNFKVELDILEPFSIEEDLTKADEENISETEEESTRRMPVVE